MPHLNWRSRTIELKAASHPKLTNQLELRLLKPDADELRAALAATFAPSGAEFKLELPSGWTIYFKRRDQSGSRLQLARPQVDQWVASVQLAEPHAQALLARLDTIHTERGVIALSELGPAVSVVNFELLILPVDEVK